MEGQRVNANAELLKRVIEVGIMQSNLRIVGLFSHYQLLEERPVWSRVALMNQFSLSQRKDVFKCVYTVLVSSPQADSNCFSSKIVLPLAAYVFNDGPFRDAYVRFGYDPRKDVEARLYVQRLT